MEQEEITTYRPNKNIDIPSVSAIRQTLYEIWYYRWLIWVSFKKEFIGQYKRSTLGILWSFILPVVPVTAYLFLAFIRALSVKGGMPYPLYIIVGMTLWLIVSEGIQSSMQAVQKESDTLSKVNIPLIAVIMAGYSKVCFNTLIRLPILVLVFVVFKIVPSIDILLFPLFLIPLLLLGLGLGIVFGMLNVMLADAQNAVAVLLRYGMFVCSVIFPMPTDGVFGAVNRLNFFNHLIVGVRDFLVFGELSDPVGFAASSVISLLIFVLALKWNYSLQYLIKGAL